jgi:hypothetical protein
MPGLVVYHKFLADLVDIAVVQLTNAEDRFPACVGVHFDRIKIADPIYVVGLKVDSRDTATEAVYPCAVNIIEPGEDSAMFQSSYTRFEGLSGAVVVMRVVNGVAKVVGVHVASHDDTVRPPEIEECGKNQKAASDENDYSASNSIASSIHGHHAYRLICEVARVPDLVAFLRERGLS